MSMRRWQRRGQDVIVHTDDHRLAAGRRRVILVLDIFPLVSFSYSYGTTLYF